MIELPAYQRMIGACVAGGGFDLAAHFAVILTSRPSSRHSAASQRLERDADRVRLCRGLFLRFGASLGVVQLFHLRPRQRRGFLDGLLSREGVAAQPA